MMEVREFTGQSFEVGEQQLREKVLNDLTPALTAILCLRAYMNIVPQFAHLLSGVCAVGSFLLNGCWVSVVRIPAQSDFPKCLVILSLISAHW
jgi:hypothetical protein